MSAVALVTTRYVDDGQDEQYLNWAAKMESALQSVPGFVAAEQIPASDGGQQFWTQVIRFSDKESSLNWSNSPQLAQLLAEVDEFSHDSEVSAVRTGTSDWLNFGFNTQPGPGAPIKWKQLIAGIMALYPTVIIAHEILSALISVPFAISTLLTNAISMSLVMLLWLPGLSKVLGFWLLPQQPLPPVKNVGVAALLLAIIGAMAMIFLRLFSG